jgi:hypothetical protein
MSDVELGVVDVNLDSPALPLRCLAEAFETQDSTRVGILLRSS